MLSRVIKKWAWGAAIIKNAAAFSLNQAAGMNQTPLNLANPASVRPSVVTYNARSLSSLPAYSPLRSAQSNIDNLAPYLEYIVLAVMALPVAAMVYLGFKKLKGATKSARRKLPNRLSQTMGFMVPQAVLPRADNSPVMIVSPYAFSAVDVGAVSNTPSMRGKRSAQVKTTVPQVITQTIREKIQQRHEVAETMKKTVKPPVSIKVKLPSKKLVSSVPVTSTNVQINKVLKASSEVVRSLPNNNSSSSELQRKTLQAQLVFVREAGAALAKFTERFPAGIQENLSDAELHIKYLVGLYRLHRYNLAVLELMCHRAAFRTVDYSEFIVPLRREFAHYSSEISPAALGATLALLQENLVKFSNIQSSLNTTNLRDFIAIINQHLRVTPIGLQCLARHPKQESPSPSKAVKNENAHAEYEKFVNMALPEMQALAEKIISLNKEASVEKEMFSAEECLQAFSMLVMKTCDHLPVHVLARLRSSARHYPEVVLLLMSKMHDFRNTLAHRLEVLPPATLLKLCEGVFQVSAYLKNAAILDAARRDSVGGRLFHRGSHSQANVAVSPFNSSGYGPSLP